MRRAQVRPRNSENPDPPSQQDSTFFNVPAGIQNWNSNLSAGLTGFDIQKQFEPYQAHLRSQFGERAQLDLKAVDRFIASNPESTQPFSYELFIHLGQFSPHFIKRSFGQRDRGMEIKEVRQHYIDFFSPEEVLAAVGKELRTSLAPFDQNPWNGTEIDYFAWAQDLIRSNRWGKTIIGDILLGTKPNLCAHSLFKDFWDASPLAQKRELAHAVLDAINARQEVIPGPMTYIVDFVDCLESRLGVLTHAPTVGEIFSMAVDIVADSREIYAMVHNAIHQPFFRNTPPDKAEAGTERVQRDVFRKGLADVSGLIHANITLEVLDEIVGVLTRTPLAFVGEKRVFLTPEQAGLYLELLGVLAQKSRPNREHLRQFFSVLTEGLFYELGREAPDSFPGQLNQFIYEVLTHMNFAKLGKKKAKSLAARGLEFLAFFVTVPDPVLRPVIERVRAEMPPDGELTEASFTRFSEIANETMIDYMLGSRSELEPAEVQGIKTHIAQHPHAWSRDNLLTTLVRFYSFQNNHVGHNAVLRFMRMLSLAEVGEDGVFRRLPRYHWPHAEPDLAEYLGQWFGNRLPQFIQTPYERTIQIERDKNDIFIRYAEILDSIFFHLGLSEVPLEDRQSHLSAHFESHGVGDQVLPLWGIILGLSVAIRKRAHLTEDQVQGWRQTILRLTPGQAVENWEEVIIDFDILKTLLRPPREGVTEARVFVDDNPVAFIRSGERPHDTCQRVSQATNFNRNGQPLTRPLHGQFILFRIEADNLPELRTILEIAHENEDKHKVLLVERKYQGTLIPNYQSDREIIRWALASGDIRYIAFSSSKYPESVTSQISFRTLPTSGPIYRDTKWQQDGITVLDLEKYQAETEKDAAIRPEVTFTPMRSSS